MKNYNEDEITIDLAFLFHRLWNFRTIAQIIVVALVCSVGAYCFSKFVLPEQFASQVNMYVKNAASSTTTSNKVEVNDINASQKIVESSLVILKDDIVMKTISSKLLKDYSLEEVSQVFDVEERGENSYVVSPAQISNSIDISKVNETEVLNIKVTTSSPKISLSICEYMMKIAPDIIKRVIEGGAIEPIGVPEMALHKSGPNNLKNGILGGMAGAFIVLAFNVLIVMLDTKIKGTTDFSQKFDIPVVGEIPFYNTEEDVPNVDDAKKSKKKKKSKDSVPGKESFAVVEAYNSLASNLLFLCRVNDKNVVLLSSSAANDGKTTTAYRTAMALNQMAGKVLLIDGDIRKASLNKLYKMKSKKGVSTVVSGMHTVEECIVRKEGLPDALLAGPVPPNVVEILASKHMDELIEKCSQLYDYVIIDTPPVNLVSDASILSKYTDGIVFVTRAENTNYKDVEVAQSNLKLADSKIAGVVINGVGDKDTYYSRYSYYGYYGYKKKHYGYGGYGYGKTALSEVGYGGREDEEKLKKSNKK